MSDKVSKQLCSALKEAISDERAAPPMYNNITKLIEKEPSIPYGKQRGLVSIVKHIIDDEKEHEKRFIRIAEELGCTISMIPPKKKEYYELPLAERIKMAREITSKL